jgi:hypothetical protein
MLIGGDVQDYDVSRNHPAAILAGGQGGGGLCHDGVEACAAMLASL